MPWEQLDRGVTLPLEGVEVPPLHPVELAVAEPSPIADVEAGARRATVERFAGAIHAGTTVAVGASSRGLSGRVELLRGVVAGLRELGAAPFVVPAMGSHGGATDVGQRATLAHLGITEDTVDAEIRATMDTVVVATTRTGAPVHLDANAAAADRVLPVNRIKPHTSFTGPVESGCAKMAVIGFGKQPGAAVFHAGDPAAMALRLRAGVDALRATGRLLGGVATVESAGGDVVTLEALGPDDVGGPAEERLTAFARSMIPTLPFAEIDVLIVEQGGKDVSGTTMDPNVTGRFWSPARPDLERPRVGIVVLLALTEATAGNALGIGFADIVPAAVARAVDWEQTYVNALTVGPAGARRARLPMVLPDEESCLRAAVAICGRTAEEPLRVVRIRSTLHLAPVRVSAALLAELPAGSLGPGARPGST